MPDKDKVIIFDNNVRGKKSRITNKNIKADIIFLSENK